MSQLNETTITRIEKYLPIFAREAGSQARHLREHMGQVSTKDGGEVHASNIVTEADRQIGRLSEEFFGQLFPGCVVIQEETAGQVDLARVTPETLIFVVDPIDGTLFYARHNFAWTVSVGCFYGWQPLAGCIYAPDLQSMYHTQDGSSFLNGSRIAASCPAGSLQGAVMVRHIRAYHAIEGFPGYALSFGSVALHLALVASGYACACVTTRHYVHDVAGAARLLENAGAELRLLNGGQPDWRELILNPNLKSPDAFFACPRGAFERLVGYVNEPARAC
jgi:fructose-1,6-bisphosphatase/inositol monophosphatase family enzyme